MAKAVRQVSENETAMTKAIALLSQIVDRKSPHSTVQVGTQFQQVGIQNISSYTLGLASPIKGEPDVQLAPFDADDPRPESRGVISFPHWQQLRKGLIVGRGMLVRDDTSLGDSAFVGPADRAEDIAPEFAINAIIDPRQWIESKTEEELREAINRLTSEPSCRRLLATVDRKIEEVGMQFKGQPDHGKLALRALPARYRMVDDLCKDRLFELIPGMNRDFSAEAVTAIRF